MAVDDAYYEKSILLRHPLIFYLGHTASFFVNKLVLAKILPERIDPDMESTFAVSVDEMSGDDLNDDHYAWPEVSAVMAYRQKVRAMVVDLIRTLPLMWWAMCGNGPRLLCIRLPVLTCIRCTMTSPRRPLTTATI